VSAWGRGELEGLHAALLAMFSVVLLLFVLVSFRRTMWGGIAISAAGIFAALPGKARLRLLLVGGAITAVAGAGLLVSPVGALLFQKVGDRIAETGVQDLSTVYRLAMFVHFLGGGDNTPLLGWGVTPLWNKIVQFGYLTFNLENMHSLYFWIWLRMGLVGFTVAVLVFLYLLWRALQIFFRSSSTPRTRVLAIVLAAMIFIFLFSGVFNPVYGEFRYIVPLGLALAILTRLPQFDRLGVVEPC
jgi:O-antigen ligase